jgi:hypothetical protein
MGLTTDGIVQLTETSRLRVVQDESPEDPHTWNDEVTDESWEYQRWVDGEVYGVILERAVTIMTQRVVPEVNGYGFVPEVGSDPSFETEWDEVDALWGCYLTSGDEDEGITEYSAEIVAAEHFTLTPEEEDGLGLTPEEVYNYTVATIRPVPPRNHEWLGRAEAAAGYVLDTRPGKNLAHLPIGHYAPALKAYRRKAELPLDTNAAK